MAMIWGTHRSGMPASGCGPALRGRLPAQCTECAAGGEAGKGRAGLNLTWEVRDGILNHKTSGSPATLEGNIVRLSDKIAYINHDSDDAIRAHVLREEDIPHRLREILGFTTRERLNTLIHDIIIHSQQPECHPYVGGGGAGHAGTEAVHVCPCVHQSRWQKEKRARQWRSWSSCFEYYLDHTDQLSETKSAGCSGRGSRKTGDL